MAAVGELMVVTARATLDLELPFLFLYFPPILASALWLGLGPGLVTTGVALAAAWYDLPPITQGSGPTNELQLLLLFALCAALGCAGIESARSGRERRASAQSELRDQTVLREEATVDARNHAARLEAILNTAVEGILTIDERGIVESMNPAAERMFGYARTEVIGRNVNLLMPPPYREEHDAYLSDYGHTGEKKIIGIGREVEGLRRDGTSFAIHLAVSEVQLAGRRIFTGFIRDLSEHKRLESEFLQSQKMEAVGALAGGIAHDFNNLLMGILACSRIAGEGLDRSSDAHEMCNEIGNAARRGIALTRRLLAFSRRQPVQLRPTSINAVIEENATMLRQLLGEDVSLRVALAESGATVRADDGLIDQILVNLLINARDAMPAGGEILVTTHDRNGSTPEITLEVRDSGCGMPPEVRERIFEPFYTTKGPDKGTGLGLSTVKRIADQLSARIEVESEVGRGTSFRLTFPRVQADAVQRTAGATQTAREHVRKTVFVVEDDRLVRSSLKRFLSSKGYDVIIAESAPEAIARSARQAFDILVTDIVLPGMSGYDLARQLRSSLPAINVIYMSAYPAETLLEQGRLEPGALYLEKPFEMESLDELLRKVLGASSAPGGGSGSASVASSRGGS